MRCPFCGYPETRVIDSRDTEDMLVTRRRRECPKCGMRFTTYERIELNITVVKRDGRREKFDRDKIIKGMLKALEKRPVEREKVEEAANRIEEMLRKSGKREVSSEYIGNLVMEELRKLDKVGYVRFASVYMQFADIEEFERILRDLKKKEE